MTIYPISTPQVKVAPAKAGPAALPRAEMLVDTPFRVPKIFRLTALFVRRIVEQGNAKMPQKHLTNMISIMTPCRKESVGSKAVNGVAIYASGKVIEQAFRQFRTPYFLANEGNTKN